MNSAFPAEMTEPHKLILEAIASGPGAGIGAELDAIPDSDLAVAELAEAGWIVLWRVDGGAYITFTPSAAAFLGVCLTAEDEPRWVTIAEAAALRAPRPKRRRREVCETDLMAYSGHRADSPGILDTFRSDHRARPDDGLPKPSVIVLGCHVWHGLAGLPRDEEAKPKARRPRREVEPEDCEVCHGGTLAPGELCGRCDAIWTDRRPGEADKTPRAVEPKEPKEPNVRAAKPESKTARAEREKAEARERKAAARLAKLKAERLQYEAVEVS